MISIPELLHRPGRAPQQWRDRHQAAQQVKPQSPTVAAADPEPDSGAQ